MLFNNIMKLFSDFYEYNLRPTFLIFKDHFLSYHRYLYKTTLSI